MRIVCWQTILMIYHTLFLLKIRKMMQNLSSAAVVIGALHLLVFYISPDQYNRTEHIAFIADDQSWC